MDEPFEDLEIIPYTQIGLKNPPTDSTYGDNSMIPDVIDLTKTSPKRKSVIPGQGGENNQRRGTNL